MALARSWHYVGSPILTVLGADGGLGTDSESFGPSTTFEADGNLSASGSGTADDRITLSALMQQATVESSASLHADLSTFVTLNATGAEYFAQFDAMQTYGFDFTLTTESLMLLTITSSFGTTGDISPSFRPENVFLTLTGPGGPLGIQPPSPNLDQSFTLTPGAYSVSFMDHNRYEPFGGFVQGEEFEKISLDARFTPVVPEPRWSAIALALFLPGWTIYHRKTRRPGQA